MFGCRMPGEWSSLIRYIVGRAGKGKTRYIFEKIGQTMNGHTDKKLLLVVPEQYTLQAERDMLDLLRLPGLIQVEVLSLSRLAERLFDEVGGLTRPLLNDQGRHMAVRRVLDESRSELQIYGRASHLPGFISQCADLLSELKQSQLLPQHLHQMKTGLTSDLLLERKLQDTALIYERFINFMDGRYLDVDDYRLLLVNRMHLSQMLRNCVVWIDGFTTFSPLALRMVQELMRLAYQTSITLTIDPQPQARDRELFLLPTRTFHELHSFAQEQGLEEKIVVIDPKPANLQRRPELLHLEAEIMAYPGNPYQGPVEAIAIRCTSNVYSEVEMLAREIVGLIRNEKWRWRDIAVVANDIASYSSVIKRTFEEYGIPCFLDQKRNILNNPLVRYILALIDTVQTGYRYIDVATLLKTDLTGLTRDECETLENYILRYGIKGRRWKELFMRGEPDELVEMNRLRQILAEPWLQLERSWKEAGHCHGKSLALYDFLIEQGTKEKLEARIETQLERGDWEMALENAQIWNIVLQILDQLAELAGDLQISNHEYRQMLETGFRSYELAIIPPTIDQVLIGNIQRSKSQDIKALFVIGANDGVLPSGLSDNNLLSMEERSLLLQKGWTLGLDPAARTAEENFLIYNAFSKPRDLLYMSYPLADAEGRALRPSLLIRRFQQLFPFLAVQSDLLDQWEKGLEAISTPGGTYKYLIKNMRSFKDKGRWEDCWPTAYNWYKNHSGWQTRLALVETGLDHDNSPRALPKEQVQGLFQQPLQTSVSRLERFVRCPFSHFLCFGLKPQERKTYELQAPDLGEFFHEALKTFAVHIEEQGISWKDLDRENCYRIMDQVTEELVPGYGEGILESSHRYRYLAHRLKRIGRRAIWTLSQELQQGSFQPLAYEVRFGSGGMFPPITVRLQNGDCIMIEGRIDRVDMMEDNGQCYLRIMDYKTGNQGFNLSEVYYGLSLQLMVYLKAVLASQRLSELGDLHPAGVFLFHIDDPLVESDQEAVQAVELLVARELRLKGLVLADIQIIRQMDHQMDSISTFLPVAINKDQSLAWNSSALAEKVFQALIAHVETLLQAIGEEISAGRISIAPVKTGARTACQSCQYQSICQFDRSLPGCEYRILPSLSREEVIQRLDRQQGGIQ
ncbi:MAG TPA: helicase-exonuclease AddAB subunit AddB [Syntrophomonadaceae bacterium]|nr:helicase-exonuclease AddAB subunit AddB [Syntrophomonadaceae bacterium]